MADAKISQLTPAAALVGDEVLPLVQDAGNVSATLNQVLALGGDLVGPAASTDNAIARFDGTTGKLLQNSAGATLSDTGGLTLAMGTVTTNQPVLDLSQTWNAGAVSFTGIKLNVSYTAAGYPSYLLDLQLSGDPRLRVDYGGNVQAAGYISSSSTLYGATFCLRPSNDAYRTQLESPSAGILELRSGTNAQAFRLYNTYTDASNYERLAIGWSTNVVSIKPENAGTGSARVLHISGLPTSNPGPGILWNNGGTPAIGT